MIDRVTYAKNKEKYKDEQVYVIPYASIADVPDGFTKINNEDKQIRTKFSNIGKYIMRYDAEGNPSFQQIIPYVIMKNGDKYFITKRLAGEHRLQGKLSIGCGGHINPCDGITEPILKGLDRELNEETDFTATTSPKFMGYIRDVTSNTNDHFGCLFIVEVSHASIKESESLEGMWMTKTELKDNYFKFEGWAKFIIDYLLNNNDF